MANWEYLAFAAAGAALAFAVAVAGCGGEKGATAAKTVTVTVQASEGGTTTEPVIEETTPSVDTTTASEEAVVAVAKIGFSQGDNDEIGYGLVLKNQSAKEDALDVEVTINLLDRSGTIVATEAERINVIPAGGTFYLGGASYATGEKAVKIEPIVAVGSSDSAQWSLPKVSRVRLVEQEYLGLSVKGQVENTLDQPLSQIAKIGVVVFDKRGNVVGGGFTFLDADLPPGRSASFDAGNGVNAIPPRKAAKASASVDNEVASR